MKRWILPILLAWAMGPAVASAGGGDPVATAPELDAAAAGRFARLALDCVHLEYPNKIAQVHAVRRGRAAAARADARVLRLL